MHHSHGEWNVVIHLPISQSFSYKLIHCLYFPEWWRRGRCKVYQVHTICQEFCRYSAFIISFDEDKTLWWRYCSFFTDDKAETQRSSGTVLLPMPFLNSTSAWLRQRSKHSPLCPPWPDTHVCVPLFVLLLAQDPSDCLVHEEGGHGPSAPLFMLCWPVPHVYFWGGKKNFGLEAVRRPQIKSRLCSQWGGWLEASFFKW